MKSNFISYQFFNVESCNNYFNRFRLHWTNVNLDNVSIDNRLRFGVITKTLFESILSLGADIAGTQNTFNANRCKYGKLFFLSNIRFAS